MNVIQKSESIKNGLWKGVQDGSSKMARRKCYGYKVGSDGELTLNPEETKVVSWIFERQSGENCCQVGKAGYSFPHWQAQME